MVLHLGSPECDPDNSRWLFLVGERRQAQKSYDPDEPRDEHGRWSSSGGGEATNLQVIPLSPGERSSPAGDALPQSTPIIMRQQRLDDITAEFPDDMTRGAAYQELAKDFSPEAYAVLKQAASDDSPWGYFGNFNVTPTPSDTSYFQTDSEGNWADTETLLHTAQDKAVAAASNGKIISEEVGKLIAGWNRDPTGVEGVAINMALAEKFGERPDDTLQHQAAIYAKHTAMWADVTQKVRAYVDAQYAVTQAQYQKAGIKAVDLARGIHFDEENTPPGFSQVGTTPLDAVVPQHPLSSWSNRLQTAYDFSDAFNYDQEASYLMTARIPVERIFSNGIFGVGVAHEGEHVVIDNNLRVKIQKINSQPIGRQPL